MTIRLTQPEINVREKLKELDGTIPYSKMPKGSCIGSAFYASNAINTGDTLVNSGNQSNSGFVVRPAFTYYKKDPNSLLYVEWRYGLNNVKGYVRETIHFDHIVEDRWNSIQGGYTTSGSIDQDNSFIHKQEYTEPSGVIAGYVVGPGVASGYSPPSGSNYFYNNKTFGGYIHYYSRFCSLALALASSDSFTIRDDKYLSTTAYVLEFKQ
jgi:hypothetical protein